MNISTENITSPEVHPFLNLTSLDLFPLNLKMCLLCTSLLVGLPTHTYVLWLIVRGRGIALEFFNFNLTVCGIITSLHSLINILLLMFSSLAPLQKFLLGISITTRPLFECLICVERYLAVVHPVTFLKYKPLRYKAICSASVWIASLGSCLACMNIYISHMNAYTWFFMIQFVFFLSIQLFCLSAVLRVLKQSGPGERTREKDEENHMKKKAFHLIFITTVNMIIMFVPFIITGFLFIVKQQDISVGWYISLFCFFLTTFVHPVLYLHRVGKPFCFCSP